MAKDVNTKVASTGVKPPRPPMPALVLARVVLGLTGLVWLVIGLWALADPNSVADSVDLRPDSPLGRLEIRAMYGGLSVMLGVLHGIAASRRAWLVQGLVVSGLLTAGLVAGRLLSVAIEGVPGPTALLLIGAEAAGITAVAVALWRLMIAQRAAKKLTQQAAKQATPKPAKAASGRDHGRATDAGSAGVEAAPTPGAAGAGKTATETSGSPS